jgi:hypothetical protein
MHVPRWHKTKISMTAAIRLLAGLWHVGEPFQTQEAGMHFVLLKQKAVYSTEMRKLKWLFMSGCEYRHPASTTIKFLTHAKMGKMHHCAQG